MSRVRFFLPLLAVVVSSLPAVAQNYLDQIGFTALQNRLGAATPNGAGVRVMQVEANVSTTGGDVYGPNPSVAAGRQGFTITYQSPPPPDPVNGPFSDHATGVATIFYGNGGMATGVTKVDSYDADHWIGAGFLGTGTAALPPITNIPKVSNHSYISSPDNATTAADSNLALLRADYLVDRGDHVMVVGVGNNAATVGNSPPAFLFGSSYNAIAVGRTDGLHLSGLTDPLVGGGRVKPDLVAPQGSVSSATPTVAAAAVLLVQVGNGLTPEATKPQVIKAVLMAGATKAEFTSVTGGPWTHSQTTPLDTRFGAGQVNINNSYTILAAGRQPASNSATVAPTGWDFNTVSAAGTRSLDYFFDVPAAGASKTVSAVLTWHRVVNDSLVAAPLTNLDLRLQNASGFTLGTMIDQSVSTVDNVEHIWVPAGLSAGRYALHVEVNGTGSADYGLAWQTNFTPVPEPGAVFVVAAMALAAGRRKWPAHSKSGRPLTE